MELSLHPFHKYVEAPE